MSTDALIALAILAGTITLFVSDKLRLDVVAMLSLLALLVTGVASVEVGLAGFSNPAVLMIAGLFVVGAGLTETGIADWLGRKLELVAGTSELRLVVAMMAGTALVSAFMSSTGTVAILLPVVGGIAARRGIAPSRLFMPLAFAAHLGSNLTLISTPPNLLVSDALRAAGHEPFRVFSFSVPGAAALVVGVAYVALAGRRLLPRATEPESVPGAVSDHELASEYGLGDALRSVRIGPSSRIIGQTLAASNLRAVQEVTVVAVLRDGESLRVMPSLTFQAFDDLLVIASDQALHAFVTSLGLVQLSTPATFSLPPEEGLAEIVLPRRSRLVGRSARAVQFRDRYRATVLGVRRIEGGRQVSHTHLALRDLVLAAGDTLLIKGRRRYLKNLHQERADMVLVSEPGAGPGALLDRTRALLAVSITLAMLLVMAFAWLPNVVAVLAAALLMVLAQCVRPSEIYRCVNWESLVLIASLIPLASVLERSGATTALVSWVEGRFSSASPLLLLVALVTLTSAMGMVLSNTATAVLLAPVAIRLASAFEIAPEPLLMGVAFAASAAFATPIASPVNVLVMTPGSYRFSDYTKMGLPLQLLVLATAIVVIPLLWPF